MKVAVAALACVVRLAVPAQASELARSDPPGLAAAAQTTSIEVAPASTKAAPPQAGKSEAAAQPLTPRETAKPRVDEARREAVRARVCFDTAQTRENVAAHRLAEPFRALRLGGQQGDALRARLCRWKQDEWVYEISVLRRDGRIVRVYMNAQNGQVVGALDKDRR